MRLDCSPMEARRAASPSTVSRARLEVGTVARLRDEPVDPRVDDVTGAAGVGDHHREATRHRLDRGDAERLGQARQHEQIGILVQPEQFGAVGPDVVVDDHARRRLDGLAGHDMEFHVVARAAADPVEQELAALPPEVAADEQHLAHRASRLALAARSSAGRQKDGRRREG